MTWPVLGDTIAWLALLRAPWCGLLLNDLHVITHVESNSTMRQQLNNQKTLLLLSKEGKQRLDHMTPILQHAFCQQTNQSFARWVELTWNALGGMALLDT